VIQREISRVLVLNLSGKKKVPKNTDGEKFVLDSAFALIEGSLASQSQNHSQNQSQRQRTRVSVPHVQSLDDPSNGERAGCRYECVRCYGERREFGGGVVGGIKIRKAVKVKGDAVKVKVKIKDDGPFGWAQGRQECPFHMG
jgi:hypothetical protein